MSRWRLTWPLRRGKSYLLAMVYVLFIALPCRSRLCPTLILPLCLRDSFRACRPMWSCCDSPREWTCRVIVSCRCAISTLFDLINVDCTLFARQFSTHDQSYADGPSRSRLCSRPQCSRFDCNHLTLIFWQHQPTCPSSSFYITEGTRLADHILPYP